MVISGMILFIDSDKGRAVFNSLSLLRAVSSPAFLLPVHMLECFILLVCILRLVVESFANLICRQAWSSGGCFFT